jgi:hypothetical protein
MPEKVLKTLVFEKTDTQQSTMVEYEFDLTAKEIDFSHLFKEHCPLN